MSSVLSRTLRRALPQPWREWLFDPSFVEIEERAAAVQRAPSWLRLIALWLQCWWVGLRAAVRPSPRTATYSVPNSSRSRPRQSVLQDFRYAYRSLRAAPGFVLVVVATLALGAGVNTAIFGVVDLLVLRPLAGVEDGAELGFVMAEVPDTGFFLGLSYPVFENLREDLEGFDDLLAYSYQVVSLGTGGGSADRTFGHAVSANYFDVLGAPMAHGRGFAADEGLVDSPAAVLVLDHGYWADRFNADPAVVGSSVEINGVPFTIVGVAPEEYLGLESMLSTQVYFPIGGLVALSTANTTWLQAPGSNAFRVVGRLSDDVTTEQASASLAAADARLHELYPQATDDQTLALVMEQSARPDPSAGGQFAGVAAIFLALVALVLTIACANVANLMLARGSGRGREIAVRSALGAGRLRVVRQLAAESALLGLAGGAVGLLVAFWAVATLRSVVASWQIEMPVRLPLEFDIRSVVFGLGVAVVAGLLAGVIPALRTSSGDLTLGLNEGARGASAGRGRLLMRSSLVVAQVAVSVVLIVAAGLFLRSLNNARNSQLGFETDGRLYVSFDPQVVGMSREAGIELQLALTQRAGALPGVTAAGIIDSPPFSPRNGMSEIFDEETAALGTERGTLAARFFVSPDYLAAAGTRLVRGRNVQPTDNRDSPLVALVNEAMASTLWPDSEAVGGRFVDGAGRTVEVVGVVEQGKYTIIWEEPRPAFFMPMLQLYPGSSTLVLHSAGDPLDQAAPVRAILAELAPSVPVFGVITAEAHLRDGRALMLVRLASGLVAAFGLLGVALATVGLYGVISYSVSARIREFGVRVALGAAPRSVLQMVLRQGLLLSGFGAAIGALLAFGLGRMLSQLLIDVSAADPLALGGGVALVLAVATAACLVPAWRATRVDPIVALRDE